MLTRPIESHEEHTLGFQGRKPHAHAHVLSLSLSIAPVFVLLYRQQKMLNERKEDG
jgi:hypothetical protein